MRLQFTAPSPQLDFGAVQEMACRSIIWQFELDIRFYLIDIIELFIDTAFIVQCNIFS
ncbi:MAG: hypothetical protein AAGM33_09195 [Pseudomonadota bacterium]